MKKNILIISPFFPPQQRVAVNRIIAYAKYLSLHHNVTVITMGKAEDEYEYSFNNTTVCKVICCTNNSPFQAILFYTGQESWLTHKFKTIVRVLFNKLNMSHFYKWRKNVAILLNNYFLENKIDVLLSSYSPEDALEVSYAALIKHNLDDVKWIMDMRDEYSDEIGLTQKVKTYRRNSEMKYSKRADLVVGVSQPQVELFKQRMPHAKMFMEVRNGFDHSLIPPKYNKGEKLKIGYFGSLHGKRNPDSFFNALIELDLSDMVEVFIATNVVNFTTPIEIKKSVTFLPFMNYSDAILKMSEMDINLLINPPSNVMGLFSGKIFDYLSSGRSVFAIVNQWDVAAKLILENDFGYVANFDSYESIKKQLKQAYQDWLDSKLPFPSSEVIQFQHRKFQVEKINKWICSL